MCGCTCVNALSCRPECAVPSRAPGRGRPPLSRAPDHLHLPSTAAKFWGNGSCKDPSTRSLTLLHMAECQRCGVEIEQKARGRKRKWCSERCARGLTGPTAAETMAALAAEFAPGTRFGRLTVVAYLNSDLVEVHCDCGVGPKTVSAYDLRVGTVLSCGCLRRENMVRTGREFGGQHRTHGLSKTPEYKAWVNIKARIFNPDHPAYPNYGGRGLTMDPHWAEDFLHFLAEVGLRPAPHLSIDRIDNDLGYVRGNLRWATPAQQTANRRAA